MEVSSKNSINSEKNLCLYCDKAFSNNKDQENHVERDHKLGQTLQGKGSRRKSERITKNNLTSENSPFPGCFHCSKKIIRTDDLDILFQHLLSSHKDVYFGCKCKIRTQDKVSLANHKKNCKIGGSAGGKTSRCSDENVTDNRKTNKKSQVIKSNGDSRRDSFSELESNVSDATSNKSKTLPPANAIHKKSDRSKLKNHSKNASVNDKAKKSKFSSSSSTTSTTSSSRTAEDEYTIPLTRQKLKEPVLKAAAVQSRTPNNKKSLKSSKSLDVKSPIAAASPTKVHRTKNNKIANASSQNPEPIENASKIEPVSSEFDEDFYRNISQNIRTNLVCFVDGKSERLSCRKPVFDQISENSEVSRTEAESKVNLSEPEKEIHESTNFELSTPFPALLTAEQYGFGDSSYNKSKRHITRNSWKWKWDLIKKYKYVNEGGKIVKKVKQITTGLKDLSQLDMWTQLSMRSRYENLKSQPEFDEGLSDSLSSRMIKTQNVEQLNTILNKRLTPQIDVEQLQQTVIKEERVEEETENFEVNYVENESDESKINLLGSFNLVRNNTCNSKNPLLSGEWARPRCYICFDCGQKFDLMKSLNDHKNSEHPYVVSAHYEIVGRENLEHKLYENLFLPKKALKANSFAGSLSVNSDSKSNETNEASTSSDNSSKFFADQKEKECSKCLKMIKYSSDIDIYRHILDCIEDRVWIQAKKRSKYRRSRRKSRKVNRRSRASFDQKKNSSSPSTKDNTEGENSTPSISNPPTPKSDPKISSAVIPKSNKIESLINDSKTLNGKTSENMNIKSFFKVSKTTIPVNQKLIVQTLEIQPNNKDVSLRSSLRSSSSKRTPSENNPKTTSSFQKPISEEKQSEVKNDETQELPAEKVLKNPTAKLSPLTISTPEKAPSENSLGSPTNASLTSPTSNSNVPKKKKKLNDCIAMLTCKIQEKLGVNFFDSVPPPPPAQPSPSETPVSLELKPACLSPVASPALPATIVKLDPPTENISDSVAEENLPKEPEPQDEESVNPLIIPQIISDVKPNETRPSTSFQIESLLRTNSFSEPVQEEVIDLSIKKKTVEDEKKPDAESLTKDLRESSESNSKIDLIDSQPKTSVEELTGLKHEDIPVESDGKPPETEKIVSTIESAEIDEEMDKQELSNVSEDVVEEIVPVKKTAKSKKPPTVNKKQAVKSKKSNTQLPKTSKDASQEISEIALDVECEKNQLKSTDENDKNTEKQSEENENLPVPEPKVATNTRSRRSAKNNKSNELKVKTEDQNKASLKNGKKEQLEEKPFDSVSKKSEIETSAKTEIETIPETPETQQVPIAEKLKEKVPSDEKTDEIVPSKDVKELTVIEALNLNSSSNDIDKIDKEELAKAELKLIEDLKVSIPKEKIPNLKEILEQYQVITINNIKISESERRAFEEQKNRILQILNKTNNAKKNSARKTAVKKVPKRRPLGRRLTSKKKAVKKQPVSSAKVETPVAPTTAPAIAPKTPEVTGPPEVPIAKIEEAIKTTNRIRCRRLSVVVDPIVSLANFQSKNRKIRLTNNSQQNGFYDLLAATESFFSDNKVAESAKTDLIVEKVKESLDKKDLKEKVISTNEAASPVDIPVLTKNRAAKSNAIELISGEKTKEVVKKKKEVVKKVETIKAQEVKDNSEDRKKPEELKPEVPKKANVIEKAKSVPNFDTTDVLPSPEVPTAEKPVESIMENDKKIEKAVEVSDIPEAPVKKTKGKSKAVNKKTSKVDQVSQVKEEVPVVEVPENINPVSSAEMVLDNQLLETKTKDVPEEAAEVVEQPPKEVEIPKVEVEEKSSNSRKKPIKNHVKKVLPAEEIKVEKITKASKKKPVLRKKLTRGKRQVKQNDDALNASFSSDTSNENDIPLAQLVANENNEKKTDDLVDAEKKADCLVTQDKPAKPLSPVAPRSPIVIEDLEASKEILKVDLPVKKKITKGKIVEKSFNKLQSFLSKTSSMVDLSTTSDSETKKSFDPFTINEDSFFNDDLDNDPSDKINDIVNNIINSSEFQIDSDTEKSETNETSIGDKNQNAASCLICKRTFRTKKVYEKHCTTTTHLMKVERKSRAAKLQEKEIPAPIIEPEIKEEKAPSPILDETKVFRTKGALKTFENIHEENKSPIEEPLELPKPETVELTKEQRMLNENEDKIFYEFKMEKKPEDMTPKDKDQLFDSLFNSLEAKTKEKKQLCYTPKPNFVATPQDSEIESSSTSWDLKHDADIEWEGDPVENVPFANAMKERFPKKFPVKINKSKDTTVSIPTKTLIMGKIFKKHRDREKQKTPQADAPNNKPGIKNSLDEIFDHLKNSAEIDDKVLTCPSPKTLLKNAGGTFSPNASNSNDMLETASQSNHNNNNNSTNSNNNNIYKNKSIRTSPEPDDEKVDLDPPLIPDDDNDDGDDGIGKRKSRRRCAIKAKTFAETWSSDEYEELHDTEDIISIINEIEKRDSVKKRKPTKSENSFEVAKKSENTSCASEIPVKSDKNEIKLVENIRSDKKKPVQLQFVDEILKSGKVSSSIKKRRMSTVKDGHKSDEETFTATKETLPAKTSSCIKKRRMSCFVPSTTSFDDRPKPKPSEVKPVKEVQAVTKTEAPKKIDLPKKVEIPKKIELPKKVEVVKKTEPLKKVEILKKVENLKKIEVQKKVEVQKKSEFVKKVETPKKVENTEVKLKSPTVKKPESEKSFKNHKKFANLMSNFGAQSIVKKKVQKHRKRPRNRVKNIAYDSDSDFELNINKKSKSSAISESSSSDEEEKKEEEIIAPAGKSVSTSRTSNTNEMTMIKESKLLPNDLKHVVPSTASTLKAAIPEDILNSSQNACNRTKRHSSEKLYYWSSSSSESDQDQAETGENEDSVMPQQPEQHGWIVGDSHKKLVTLLAHAKIKNKIN